MKFKLQQLAQLLGATLQGNGQLEVSKIQNIEEAQAGSITFLSNPKYEPHLYKTQATAVIVGKDIEITGEVSSALLRVDDAYTSFTTLLEEYKRLVSFKNSGIESPSYISEGVQLDKTTYVGAFAYLGKGVTIGKNVKLFPQVFLGENCVVGDNTIIYSGAKIYANTKIGSHCTIQAGAVLGSDGFGFAPQQDGSYKAIPQVGNVILEDHVDIGANTVVDCATFESTIIKRGVKLDNLIQVAHNVEIGQNTVIAAQAGIAGSTKIGQQCVIGGQAGIVGHIKLGNGTKVQAQSGITKNTKDESAWYGSPAIDYSNYVKSYTVFRKLPQVMKSIQELEEKILNLAAK